MMERGCAPTRLMRCFDSFLSKRYASPQDLSDDSRPRFESFDRCAAMRVFKTALPFPQQRGAKEWPSVAPSSLQLHRPRRC